MWRLASGWKYFYRTQEYSKLVYCFKTPPIKDDAIQPRNIALRFSTWLLPNKLRLQYKQIAYGTHSTKQQYNTRKRLFFGTILVAAVPTLWLNMFYRSECLGLHSNDSADVGQTVNGSYSNEANGSSLESTACVDILSAKEMDLFRERETISNIVYWRSQLLESVILTRARVFMLHDFLHHELLPYVTTERMLFPSSFRLSVVVFVTVIGSILHWCRHTACWKELFLFSCCGNSWSKLMCIGMVIGHYAIVTIISHIIATTVLFLCHTWNHRQSSHLLNQIFLVLSPVRVVLNNPTLHSESFDEKPKRTTLREDEMEEWNEEFSKKQISAFVTLYSCSTLLREQIKRFQKYVWNQLQDSKRYFGIVSLTGAIGSSIITSRILSQWEKTFSCLSTWIDEDSCSNTLLCIWYASITGLYAWHVAFNDKWLHLLHKEPEHYLEAVRQQSEYLFNLWSQLENEAKQLCHSQDNDKLYQQQLKPYLSFPDHYSF